MRQWGKFRARTGLSSLLASSSFSSSSSTSPSLSGKKSNYLEAREVCWPNHFGTSGTFSFELLVKFLNKRKTPRGLNISDLVSLTKFVVKVELIFEQLKLRLEKLDTIPKVIICSESAYPKYLGSDLSRAASWVMYLSCTHINQEGSPSQRRKVYQGWNLALNVLNIYLTPLGLPSQSMEQFAFRQNWIICLFVQETPLWRLPSSVPWLARYVYEHKIYFPRNSLTSTWIKHSTTFHTLLQVCASPTPPTPPFLQQTI